MHDCSYTAKFRVGLAKNILIHLILCCSYLIHSTNFIVFSQTQIIEADIVMFEAGNLHVNDKLVFAVVIVIVTSVLKKV